MKSGFFFSRRDFMKLMGFSATANALRPQDLFAGSEKFHNQTRPNILLIHADQHRTECLGCYGNKDIKTPNIDSLANDGVTYTNSFCTFPVCTPSRYSMLSGLDVHEHNGWNNHSTLSNRFETFPKILQQGGYKTKAVGKMHFTPTYLDVGFDEMFLAEQDGPGRWDDDYHRCLMKNDLVDRNDLEDQLWKEYRPNAPKEYWDNFGALVSNLKEKDHSTTWTADRAVEDLRDWTKEGGKMLMVGFIKPHHPFDPPAPWNQMYDPKELSILPGWTKQCPQRNLDYNKGYLRHEDLTEDRLRRVMAYYYASISQIDSNVGRMIKILKDKGIYENTMIIYTSDHGDYMGHQHMVLKANLMYDPVMKVPLIIKWPSNKKAKQVSGQLVSNVDLASTICTIAGLNAAPEMKGRDLTVDDKGRKYVFGEYIDDQLMVRSKTRKLISMGEKKLFFDLEKDPFELNNVYDLPQYKNEIEEMTQALPRWRGEGKTIYLNEAEATVKQPNVPPKDLSHREKLRLYFKKKMSVLQGANS